MKASLIILLTFSLIWVSCQQEQLKFQLTNDTLTLLDQGKPVYSYQLGTQSQDGKYARSNYIHPLYSPEGVILTEDFPEDHYHHRGVFWTWHQLYTDTLRLADPWLCDGIEWQVKLKNTTIENEKAVANLETYWVITDTNAYRLDSVIREDITISYQQIRSDLYLLDIDITIQPLVEGLRLGGSEDPKGYGGFSVRLRNDQGLTFSGANGTIEPQSTPVKGGGWVTSSNITGTDSEVTMMIDTTNLPQFQGWILRKKNSMQNAAFPGREAMPIDSNLILRHRLVVGSATDAQIQQLYQNFIFE